MVAGHAEHEYVLFHHFGKNCHANAQGGTMLHGANVSAPYLELSVAKALAEWKEVEGGKAPRGAPDVIQSNFFECPSITTAPIVYVIYDLTFLVCPEFLTPGHYIGCLPGVCDALSRASGLIFISEYTLREFESVFPGWLATSGMPHRVILLASRGAESSRTGERGSTAWLSVGTIEPRKNHATLIAAHDLYWDRSASKRPLVFAGGKGWLSADLHGLMNQREKEGRLRYAGYVSEAELNELYGEAFAFIYPSYYEGFGLPVLEAMEKGVPVISSNSTSLPEVGGDAALYFDPHSPGALADRMLELERDENLRGSLTERGRRRAEEFSWSKVAAETLDFYREVRKRWDVRWADKP